MARLEQKAFRTFSLEILKVLLTEALFDRIHDVNFCSSLGSVLVLSADALTRLVQQHFVVTHPAPSPRLPFG